MGEIPMDVLVVAEEVIMETRWDMIPVGDFNHAAELIARAILAERQRCAEVAMTCDFEMRTPPFASVGVADARKGIASAILNP